MKKQTTKIFNLTVVVAALGYFVDIYDLVLFSIVRVPSLKDLNIPDVDILGNGVFLLNMQMSGMLIGGILWGVLGDKKGRVSVLFGSIFLYSIANILNAFVTNIEQYSVLRFLAGVGLAGELGVAITLVSEVMTKETRGYGTTIVAAVGVSGAVVAALVGDFFNWKIAYIVGGSLGIVLLLLRIGLLESHLFNSVKESKVKRGQFYKLFTPAKRFKKYLNCILIGLPIWYVIGILVTLAPEFAKANQISGTVTGGYAIMYCYIGLVLGDFTSGLLSQKFKSRKKITFSFILITLASILIYLFNSHSTAFVQYVLCVSLGFGVGYWAVFITNASEQFGTNLRATVTTTVPNFVRGSLVPITLIFKYLITQIGIIPSALVVGCTTVVVALFALRSLEETYGKDLDYNEVI